MNQVEIDKTWEIKMRKSKIKIMLASESRIWNDFNIWRYNFLNKKLDIISE